jgi:LCP family protein required for cell wall assembly
VNLDTKEHTASVMQIPRDTLVNINVPTNKANAAYASYVAAAVKAGSNNAHKTAMEQYKSLLEKSLCVEIHHAAVVNLDSFITIVDMFGGVDIYIPEAMHYEDPEQDLFINIGAGQQHLDGYNSMCYVRFRSGLVQADLGRVNAQKIFMTAFLQKVKNSLSLTNLGLITEVANTIFRNVVTDMTVSDLIFYGKALLNIDLSSIDMMTLPGNIETNSSYFILNRAAVLETVNEHFNIYTKKITDSIFDRNRIFCDGADINICNIYYGDADNIFDGVHNAEDINNDSIYIPRLPEETEE